MFFFLLQNCDLKWSQYKEICSHNGFIKSLKVLTKMIDKFSNQSNLKIKTFKLFIEFMDSY